MDFYESFKFLTEHPIFSNAFSYCLDVDVVKVDPETNQIEEDEARNTKVQVWLECGPADFDEYGNVHPIHDYSLDCGGDSFEEAIIHLAKLVEKKYGGPDTPMYMALMKELTCRKPIIVSRAVISSEFPFDDDDDEFPFEENYDSGFPFDDDDENNW